MHGAVLPASLVACLALTVSTTVAAGRFQPADGFEVEVVAEGIGSLIALASDPFGRLYLSVEGGGILRLSDPEQAAGPKIVAPYSNEIASPQGMCWLDGGLYVTGPGPDGLGLYRLDDAERNPVLVGLFGGPGGGHGAHAVVPGRDGRLYIALGSDATLTAAPGPRSPYRITYEGHPIAKLSDPLGHSARVTAPGGTIVSVDRAGQDWRVHAGGLRNPYDLAFNVLGDMFTVDADMEWDIGLPWYRPVRLLHLVPGGEYGWRAGSSKWPSHYADSLPSVMDLGRGSPTGMLFYRGHRFPERLHGALIVGDWSLGKILGFRLTPDGASYRAEREVLLSGLPLNVTDLVHGSDGSILFSTGGRGTTGGVYRLRYTAAGEKVAGSPWAAEAAPPPPSSPLRSRIRFLSTFTPFAEIFSLLQSDDRFARFAAARSLERRDPADWEEASQALADPLARAEALVAAARSGFGVSDPEATATRLHRAAVPFTEAEGETTRLTALRALQLLLIDGDASPPTSSPPSASPPSASPPTAVPAPAASPASPLATSAPATADREVLAATLVSVFPTGSPAVDRELGLILAALGTPRAVEPLLGYLEASAEPVEQIHAAYCLRTLRGGWSRDARERFQRWLREAQTWTGGNSFGGYLGAIARETEWMLDAELRAALGPERRARTRAPRAPVAPQAAQAPVVTTTALGAEGATDPSDPVPDQMPLYGSDRVLAFLQRVGGAGRRSRAEGARVFQSLCGNCHSYGRQVGGLGPDLTTVRARFAAADLLRAIREPSYALAEGYRAVILERTDGSTVEGLPVIDDGARVALLLGDESRLEVDAADIVGRRFSNTSIMPTGLLDYLTLEEIADLFAFLGGDGAPDYDAWRWTRPFDEVSFHGFVVDPTLWTLVYGTIVGQAKDRPGSSYFVSEASYDDFTLEIDVKLERGNSGIGFRGTPNGAFGLTGYQADAGNGHWGELYEEGGRETMLRVPPETIRTALVDGDWNHYVIEARGHHIRLELNGVTTAEIDDPAGALGGQIGLQLHGAGATSVRFRNLRVRVPEAEAR